MFIFCPRRQKTNQKNAAQEEEGLTNKSADKPHFYSHRHPLPLKDLPHLSAEPTSKSSNIIKQKALCDKASLPSGNRNIRCGRSPQVSGVHRGERMSKQNQMRLAVFVFARPSFPYAAFLWFSKCLHLRAEA